MVIGNGRVVGSRSRGLATDARTPVLAFRRGTFALHCDARRGGVEAAVSLMPARATLTGRVVREGDERATEFRADPGQQVATALSSAEAQTWVVRFEHKPGPERIRLHVRFDATPRSTDCLFAELRLTTARAPR